MSINLEIDLRQIRLQKNQTIKEVAKQIGVAPITVSFWELGRSSPSPLKRSAILKWLIGITDRNIKEKDIEMKDIEEVSFEEWFKGKGSSNSDQFLVELERPSGVSKIEMANYIDTAIKVECGCRSPEDPLFFFHQLRNTVKVFSRS